MLNVVDRDVALWINQFVGQSPGFDAWVAMVAGNGLIKGAALIAVLWWLWFRREARDRGGVITAAVGASLGLVLARGLAQLLPFRDRPFHDVLLHLNVPAGMDASGPQLWSSFPSDHATAFFALSTGIFLASRRIGMLSYAWTIVVICLPRFYLGLHFPLDLLAGAALGITTAFALWHSVARVYLTRWASMVQSRYEPAFYVSVFVWSYSMSEMFDGARRVLGLLARM